MNPGRSDKTAGRTGLYGASGSGKSTLAKLLLADRRRLVVFDPVGEYGGRGLGIGTATTLRQVRRVLAAGWRSGFRVAYIPPAGREPEFLHHLARLVIAAQRPYFEGRDRRILTLAVEEMNLSFPVAALPRELGGMPELCSRGRHHGVELFGITQRLAEVSTRFRGNTTAAYFFRQGDHADLRAASKILGPQWSDRLAGLQTHQYLRFEAGSVEPGQTPVKKMARG